MRRDAGQAQAPQGGPTEPAALVPARGYERGSAQGYERGPVLRIEDLAVAVGAASRRRVAVDGVSLRVHPGEVVALVGESGCGKSLTALAAIGLLPAGARVLRGDIEVNGQNVTGADERALRRMRGSVVSMVFQDPMVALSPLQPIGAQIAEPLAIHTDMRRRERRERVLELLDAVGVPDPPARLRQLPYEFSGGLRQRIMIAAALACRPRLLIADEPTTALDVTTQAQILDLLRELCAAQGTACLFITHDMGVVAEIADHVTVMYAGRVVESAPMRELFARPAHPYTAALLASVPRLDTPVDLDLPAIPGRVPAAGEAPAGCPFRDRCRSRIDRCADVPPLLGVGPRHEAACWNRHTSEEQ